MFVVTIRFASAQVLLDQVLYDPINTESGGECVILHNYGESAVSLQGYTIMTASSDNDAVLSDFVLLPGSSFVLADTGWNQSKDNSSWPSADFEGTLTIGNTNSGLALVYNGTILDALGWGVPVDARLYQGAPSSQVNRSGQALIRIARTGNNSHDFMIGSLFQGQGSTASGDVIPLEVVVVEPEFFVSKIFIDNKSQDNVSIIPWPGATKTFQVAVNASGRNLSVTADFAGERYVFLRNNSLYTTILRIPYSRSPGIYDLSFSVIDGAHFEELTRTIIIQPLLALELINASVSVTGLYPGSSLSPGKKPSIKNVGNVPMDMDISSTTLSSGQNRIDNGVFLVAQDELDLSSPHTILTNLGPTQYYFLDLLFEIPITAQAGTYKGQLAVKARSVS